MVQLVGHRRGHLDIGMLAGLVAAAEQHDQDFTTLYVLHPVARAEVDLEFAQTASQHSMVARISEREAVNPDLDPASCSAVAQAVEPRAEYVGLPDLDHAARLDRGPVSVNCGLQTGLALIRPLGTFSRVRAGEGI